MDGCGAEDRHHVDSDGAVHHSVVTLDTCGEKLERTRLDVRHELGVELAVLA